MTFFQKSNYVLIAIALLLVNHLQAQCYSWEAHPQNIQTAKEQHQRYRDLFRAKKYKEAFPVWKKLFRHVQSPKEVPIRHFKDGIKMYKVFAKTEKDKESKLEYIDTIVNLYNQLARCVGEKSLDRAWQGYSIYFLEGEAQMAIEAFEKSIDLGGDSTHSMVLLPITRLSIYLYKKKHPHFTKQYLSQLYYKLKSIADYNIVNNHKKGTVYKEKWDKAYLEFFALRDSLNTIWDCKYYENQWKLKYLADSNNIEQNK